MEKITLEFIHTAVLGSVVNQGAINEFTKITTDTRKIVPGSLFIALKGERFDGNDFLNEAFDKGAAVCIAERPCEKGTVIVVPDTRAALLALAGAYRRLFDIPVVGITGSVGKTSTKEMVCCVLSQRFETHKNEGNLNNETGMPLSVFGLSKRHGAAVFEMGMSGFGEILRLSKMALPWVAVITNIGISHIEKLGTQENILKAKLEILDGLERGGTLVVNGDDRILRGIDIPGTQIFTYGIENENCGVYADNIVTGQNRTNFDIHFGSNIIQAEIPACGRHNIYNALVAFVCGHLLGLMPEEAAGGLRHYTPSKLRQRINSPSFG
jgi:UDP-N-acetylmuramoyl-tripeptide--D-alanyl-D-alanine ligase